VPAALLSYFLIVDGFLKHADKMNIKLLIMVAFTLCLSAFIGLIPFGILVFGGPRKKKVANAAKVKEGAIAAAAISGESSEADVMEFDSSADAAVLESMDEVAVLDSSDEAAVFDSDTDMVVDEAELELDDTTAFGTPVEGSEFELADSGTLSEGDSSEIEFEDEVIFEDDDEDEPPAKKKRR